MKRTLVVQAGCAALTICCLVSPALAQTSGTANAENPGELQDIVVTAQRRAESLQDVPVAVNAFSASELVSRGVTGISADSLSSIVPSFQGQSNIGRGNYYIRGVGNNVAANEASVALYVDGVYLPSTVGNILELNNVERIEVLKGPQGTLFGRNATAGVIQIITKMPDLTHPTLEAMAGYGNYNTFEGSVYASSPLSQNVAVDIAAQYKDQNDGTGINKVLNTSIGKGWSGSVRSKLLLEPSDTTKIWLSGDYSKSNTSFGQQRHPNGQPDLLGNVEPQTGGRDFFINFDPKYVTTQYGGSLHASHDFDFATLVSTTAYRNQTLHSISDSDGSTSQILNVDANQVNNAWSQEFQLVSPKTGALSWQAGVFLYDLKFKYAPPFGYGLSGFSFGPSASSFFNSLGESHTQSLATYAQATYEISPGTSLTGGLRYTWEKVNAHSHAEFNSGPTPESRVHANFQKLTWRAAIEHNFSRDVMIYGSYNRGVKSGGFNLFDLTQAYLRPEVLDAYEVGIKSEWLGRSLRINASGYYYDYQDLHVSAFDQDFPVLRNAAAAEIYGLDLDISYRPVENLTVSANFAFNHSKFTDFKNAVTNGPSGAQIIFDATGRRLPFASPFAASLNATYDIPTRIGDFTVSGTYSYNDGYNWEASGRYQQKSYSLVSANISWWNAHKRFGVELWGKNLTNTYYLAGAVAIYTGDLEVPADPRTYGLRLKVKI